MRIDGITEPERGTRCETEYGTTVIIIVCGCRVHIGRRTNPDEQVIVARGEANILSLYPVLRLR